MYMYVQKAVRAAAAIGEVLVCKHFVQFKFRNGEYFVHVCSIFVVRNYMYKKISRL